MKIHHHKKRRDWTRRLARDRAIDRQAAYDADDGPFSEAELAHIRKVAEAKRPRGKVLRCRTLAELIAALPPSPATEVPRADSLTTLRRL